MAEPQPSKLVMRVRFPSPAPTRKRRSTGFARSLSGSQRGAVGRFGPHMGHRSQTLCILATLVGMITRRRTHLLDQAAECLCDRLITVPRGVLIYESRSGT